MNGALPLWLREKSRGLCRSETPPTHTNDTIATLFLAPPVPGPHFLQSPVSALSLGVQASLAVCLEEIGKLISTQVRLPEYCLRPNAFLKRLYTATRDNPLTQRTGAKR